MVATVIAILFAASAIAALGVIGSGWLRHAPTLAVIREQLADCDDRRELRFTIREINVRRTATVYYPDFGPVSRSVRPAVARRAAA